MRRIKLSAALLVCAVAALAFAACKADDMPGAGGGSAQTSAPQTANASASPAGAPAAQTTPADGVRRISIADSRAAVERGEAVIIDVRSKTEYDRGHIKGSLSFPKNDAAARAGELPKDKLIIAYCA